MLIPDQGLYLKNANRLFEATDLVQPDPGIALPSLMIAFTNDLNTSSL